MEISRPILNGRASRTSDVGNEASRHESETSEQELKAAPQTIYQVFVEGQDPTDELVESFRADNALPELSDEELERQALAAQGDDGDVCTPE